MFKGIARLLGFDFIKNQTIRKVVRVMVNVGLAAVAGANPASAPLLALIGLVPGPGAVAAAGAILGAVEAVRNEVKHSGE